MDTNLKNMKTARQVAKEHELQCEDGGPNYHTDSSIEAAMIRFASLKVSEAKQQEWISNRQIEIASAEYADGSNEMHDFQNGAKWMREKLAPTAPKI